MYYWPFFFCQQGLKSTVHWWVFHWYLYQDCGAENLHKGQLLGQSHSCMLRIAALLELCVKTFQLTLPAYRPSLCYVLCCLS